MRIKIVITFAALFCCALATAQSDADSLFAQRLASEQLTDSTDEQRCAYRFAEGVRLRLAGDYDEAFRCFAASVELCDDAEIYYEMWKIASMSEDSVERQSAQHYLYAAIERAPDNVGYKEALAAWCAANGHYDIAAMCYEKLLKQQPNNERYLYILAVLYQEYPLKRLDVLRRLERLNGVSEENSYEQLSLLIELGRYREAEKQIFKLIKRFPYETSYRVLLGNLYIDWGKEAKALECCNQVLATDSLNGEALVLLATYYGLKGDTVRADEYMLKSLHDRRLDFDSRAPWVRSHFVSLVMNNDTAKINDFLDLLVALYPDEEQVWQLQVDYLLSRGDVAATEQPLRRIVALNPQNEKAWVRLLQVCNCSDDDRLALIDSALAQFQSPYWHFWRVDMLFALNRSAEALAAIDTALAIDMPDAAKAHFYTVRGDFMSTNKHYEQAIADYEQALRLNPTSTMAQNNYAYLLACLGRDLAKAEKLSTAAVKAEPETATFIDTYAWVLFVRGDYRLARFYQERAIALAEASGEPAYAEFYEHYGDILSLLGETDAAVEQWRKALDAGSHSPVIRQKIETKQYIPNPIEIDRNETK